MCTLLPLSSRDNAFLPSSRRTYVVTAFIKGTPITITIKRYHISIIIKKYAILHMYSVIAILSFDATNYKAYAMYLLFKLLLTLFKYFFSLDCFKNTHSGFPHYAFSICVVKHLVNNTQYYSVIGSSLLSSKTCLLCLLLCFSDTHYVFVFVNLFHVIYCF